MVGIQSASAIADEVYDLSHCIIGGHAMDQYILKCYPHLTFVEANQQMKEKLKRVRKVKLNKKKMYKEGREAYIDEDENIYIVEKLKGVVTVFPNERIFVSKTFYANKKTGKKYL